MHGYLSRQPDPFWKRRLDNQALGHQIVIKQNGALVWRP